jgi:anthranilate synthase/aminodeoxychorismate synthase-like glutamine amidotransferase
MILIIDNFDSFTYNLVQYFQQLDTDTKVYRNNKLTIKEIKELDPQLIVLSPGPGNPSNTGITKEVIHTFKSMIPILGVCLGHQTIIEYFGGKVEKAISPMHGKVSLIEHDGQGLFKNLQSPIKVTRYHSLVANNLTLPDELDISARTLDGTIMAIKHRTFPTTAVQFHPESILTEYGFEILQNGYNQALSWKKKRLEGVL